MDDDGVVEPVLLVGDNPFHGISHLSQERARVRGDRSSCPGYAAELVLLSVENGANGFMFSVSDNTLSILREIRDRDGLDGLWLYGVVPYMYEYVRLAIQVGGMPGLAKRLMKEIVMSGNLGAMGTGLKGVLTADLESLMKTYLSYEIAKIQDATGKNGNIKCVMLHETVTDLALALNLDWMIKAYVQFLTKMGVTPGFNTGNFWYLVNKFAEWSIPLGDVEIAAPFNKVGFQMVPSQHECEKALALIPEPNVIAISILAAGYVKPQEAVSYIAGLPNIKGVAVGVSKPAHARETFRLLKEKLD